MSDFRFFRAGHRSWGQSCMLLMGLSAAFKISHMFVDLSACLSLSLSLSLYHETRRLTAP